MLVRGLVFLLVCLPCAQELLDVLEDPTAMAALRGILQEILARKGIDSCPEGNSLLKLHRLETRCSRQGQEIRALTARASELLRATLPSNLPFLSDNIMLHIARHLDVRSLGRLAIVEKRLMKIVNEAARLQMAKLCPDGCAPGSPCLLSSIYQRGSPTSAGWLSMLSELQLYRFQLEAIEGWASVPSFFDVIAARENCYWDEELRSADKSRHVPGTMEAKVVLLVQKNGETMDQYFRRVQASPMCQLWLKRNDIEPQTAWFDDIAEFLSCVRETTFEALRPIFLKHIPGEGGDRSLIPGLIDTGHQAMIPGLIGGSRGQMAVQECDNKLAREQRIHEAEQQMGLMLRQWRVEQLEREALA